jgi:hypothetical protein
MKSNILPISAALAALVVAVLLPFSVTAAGVAATLIGLLAILCADYGRNLEPLRPQFQAVAFDVAACRQVELNPAA